MTSRRRKIALMTLAAALAGALGYVAFRPHPTPVDLATVTRGPLVVTINADGQTRIREIYDIAAPISGTARRSPVDVGDTVTRGQTIAIVEPAAPGLIDSRARAQLEAAIREAEAGARLAEAQLAQAEEELAYAQSQVERVQALVARGAASLTALEDAQQRVSLQSAARAAAASQVDMAGSSLARARAALIEPDVSGSGDGTCCIQITAPVDGMVLSVAEISERPVAAGAPLLSLGDPADLEITAELLSSDAVRLAPGARAMIERWGGQATLEARLRELSPLAQTRTSSLGIEEQRVSAVFDLLSPPEARPGLGHRYAVFLRIVTWEAEDVLQVPLSAIFRDGAGWAVFVVRGGQARMQAVEIGMRSERMVQLHGGLAEGDRVIVHPGEGITGGLAIIDREAL